MSASVAPPSTRRVGSIPAIRPATTSSSRASASSASVPAGVRQLRAAERAAADSDAARAEAERELLGLARTGRQLVCQARRLDGLRTVQEQQRVELHGAQVEAAGNLEHRPVKRPDHPQPRRHVM